MPTSLTGAERRLRAQIAANTRWAKPGARQAQSDTIREVRLTALADRIDPDGQLDPAERAQLAANALSAEMQRLSFLALRARRGRN